jgi:hypothetical protein
MIPNGKHVFIWGITAACLTLHNKLEIAVWEFNYCIREAYLCFPDWCMICVSDLTRFSSSHSPYRPTMSVRLQSLATGLFVGGGAYFYLYKDVRVHIAYQLLVMSLSGYSLLYHSHDTSISLFVFLHRSGPATRVSARRPLSTTTQSTPRWALFPGEARMSRRRGWLTSLLRVDMLWGVLPEKHTMIACALFTAWSPRNCIKLIVTLHVSYLVGVALVTPKCSKMRHYRLPSSPSCFIHHMLVGDVLIYYDPQYRLRSCRQATHCQLCVYSAILDIFLFV